MDKRMLQKTFREYKKTAKTDFAITNPDSFGDCPSCVWSSLVDKYGSECHGVWAKAWKYGMNGGDDIEEDDSVVIAHDLTKDQADAFYNVFSENYNITPSEYNSNKCFRLYEKDQWVFEVSYEGEYGRATYEYTDRSKAAEWLSELFMKGHTDAQMRRVF